MPTREPLRTPDRERLLREIEQLALRDSQADWSGVAPADAPPGPVHRGVDEWLATELHRIDAVQEDERERLAAQIRAAEAAANSAVEVRNRAEDAAADAVRQREAVEAVLDGHSRGDDGGDWSDTARKGETPWRRRLGDLAVYGSAGVADAGINYLALRLMGVSPVETALLAFAVVLVSVLLPKQLGVVLATVQRTGRWTSQAAVLAAVGGTVWIVTMVFAAIVRTAYLLLPAQTGALIGRPALLTVAGVTPATLTAGWLAVALAIGLAVLLRSAAGHNPYVAAWRRAVATAERRESERSARREDAEMALQEMARLSGALRRVDARHTPLARLYAATAAELKERYVQALGRYRSSTVERHLSGPSRTVLEPPADGAAA